MKNNYMKTDFLIGFYFLVKNYKKNIKTSILNLLQFWL